MNENVQLPEIKLQQVYDTTIECAKLTENQLTQLIFSLQYDSKQSLMSAIEKIKDVDISDNLANVVVQKIVLPIEHARLIHQAIFKTRELHLVLPMSYFVDQVLCYLQHVSDEEVDWTSYIPHILFLHRTLCLKPLEETKAKESNQLFCPLNYIEH